MNLFGTVLRGLGTALQLQEQQHRVISENLANAETPGYRTRRLEFSEQLREAFEDAAPTTEDGGIEAEVVRDTRVKIDGNSVDLDVEMARMSENALRTVALSRLLARKYGLLKAAITGVR